MSVRVCVAVHRAHPRLIAAMLAALTEHNVAQYKAGLVKRPPWHLEWRPDQLVECDDDGCRIASTSTMRDAKMLEDRGYGSCGELACSYAAWLEVNKGGEASLTLIRTGADTYHVIAEHGGQEYDPQTIGGQ